MIIELIPMLLLEILESHFVRPHEKVLWRLSAIEIAEWPCIRTERQKLGGIDFGSSQVERVANFRGAV